MRVLILGGTTEARELAAHLARRDNCEVQVSLAGRTATPADQGVAVRIGGFGGADGLATYLSAHRIDVLVDATHPYAAQISANAAKAAGMADTKALALRRPPWRQVAGDRWHEVTGTSEAAQVLGPIAKRVFLALGRKELNPFEAAPHHIYLIRSIDPVDPPLALPDATYVLGRGPFSEETEHNLLERHGIDVIVAKNSGGTSTYGKIKAARVLGIEVILLRRPVLAAMPSVESVEDALAWLDHALGPLAARGV